MWHDKGGKELHPHTNYYVGGNTKFYGAALFRLRKEDFGEIRHHGGFSPAWPIRYEDIEPYYTEAERLYHVHGNRGEDPAKPPAKSEAQVCAVDPALEHANVTLKTNSYVERLKPIHPAARSVK